MPLGPFAEELSAALLVKDSGRALSVLMRAVESEWKLPDVEEFDQVGTLAERAELAFRHRLVNRRHPGIRPSSQQFTTERA